MIYTISHFLVNVYLRLYYKFEIKGKENIPSSGALIICSNHIHWADPFIVAAMSTRRKMNYMAKAELFNNTFVSWLLKKVKVFPVKRGQNDVGAIKTTLRLLKEGEVLGIFPEGTRVKGEEEKKPEAGLAMFAVKSKAAVIPIRIAGEYKFRNKITMIIGKPIILDQYYNKKVNKEELEQISYDIMQEIRNLK